MSLHRRRVNKLREAEAEIREQQRGSGAPAAPARAGPNDTSVLRNALVRAAPRGWGQRPRAGCLTPCMLACTEACAAHAAPLPLQLRYLTTVAMAAAFWVVMQLIFRYAGHALPHA
jgi:hypothetical protein